MAAGNTGESRLIGTILFINTTTYRAGSRSIARINGDYLNPAQNAFVLDKRPKLSKRPTMQSSPLGAPDRNPFADILKAFKGNSASGALRFGYYFLADAVVYITGKACFLSRQLLQSALCRLCSFFLKLRAKIPMPMSYSFNCLSGKNFSIGIGGDICDSKIDTKKTIRINWRSIREDTILKQEEHAVFVNKVGLSFNSLKHLFSIITNNKGHNHSSRSTGDGNTINPLIGEKPVVENNSSMRFEFVKRLFVSSIGFDNLSYRSDRILRREVKLLSYHIITFVMDSHLGRCLKVISNLGSQITCLVETLNNVNKFGGLFVAWQ